MAYMKKMKEFFGLEDVDATDASVREDSYYSADVRDSRDSYGSSYSADSYAERSGSYGYSDYSAAEPVIVAESLESFKDAPLISEAFKRGNAVVFELTDAEKSVARRIIDFAAGMAAGTGGEFKKLTAGMETERLVFSLCPPGVVVSVRELETAAQLR